MKCNNCGNMLNGGDEFCVNCGKKVEIGMMNEAPVQNEPVNQYVPYEPQVQAPQNNIYQPVDVPKAKSGNKNLLIIIGVVVLVAIIGVLLFLLLSNNGGGNNNGSNGGNSGNNGQSSSGGTTQTNQTSYLKYDRNGFLFKYPSDWLIEYDSVNKAIQFTDYDDTIYGISQLFEGYSYSKIKENAESIKAQFLLDGLSITKHEELTIDNRKIIVFSGLSNGYNIDIAYVNSGITYVFAGTIYSQLTVSDKAKQEALKIMASMEKGTSSAEMNLPKFDITKYADKYR